ncbi:Transcription factor VIP1 [Hibiscus syriacus]|uniref:Transcription factor VIP1 n=1 Tax=Hibiscus syriacus TaxID=106335 RepID=A0A6A3BF73_HIBSY|nr:transcription factor RF2b-like [Hibiscus syriacus]KAE8714767.1 Transcription factor VIP1 [Hibiscus syriacus]
MQDPPNLIPNLEPPIPSDASSTTQTSSSFPNNTTPFRGTHHRRAHSEVQFRIPDELDLGSDTFEGLVSENELLCSYLDIEKFGGSSKGADEIGAVGSSSGGSVQNQKGEEMSSGGSGKGEKKNHGKGRHRYSNSVDECFTMELIEAKKAMSSDQLAELWTVDPKRAKRIIANRQSAARSKERKARYMSELERKIQTLQTEATTLSAQLTLFQRDVTSLTTENTELKLQLQAMEQQAWLRDAFSEQLKKEVETLKIATGEETTPTDAFNLGMHNIPYTQSSFFPPQPQNIQIDIQNIQMPPFHPFQSNTFTTSQPVVGASYSHLFSDMMQQDPLGQLQGLDINSRDSHSVKSDGSSISASESSGTL